MANKLEHVKGVKRWIDTSFLFSALSSLLKPKDDGATFAFLLS